MDVVFRLFGKGILNGFCDKQAEYKILTQDELKHKFKKEAQDRFIAVLFLRNSNYEKYNHLLVDYWKDYANKN